MKGKERCRILKEIRQKIADENGIEYITSECKHKGDCRGTCPKCEAEVRYLERELQRRARLGKAVAVAGVAMSIALTGVGCTDDAVHELNGDVAVETPNPGSSNNGTEAVEGLIEAPENEKETNNGDVPYINENGEEDILTGETDTIELAGDIAVPPLMGQLPSENYFFFPETPDGYEGYDVDFINESLSGMTIDEITEKWGESDMSQEREGRGIIGYFTDSRDIVIQYNAETREILNATTIENE